MSNVATTAGEPSYFQLEQDEASETDIESPSGTTAASIRSRTRTRTPDAVGLTFLNGLALVLGLQIGSGIFLAPAQVSRQVVSPGLGVLVWFLGGCFVWTGVCSFIELGTSIPINGGLQEYLRYCYGDFAGVLFSWTWVVIARSASMAVNTSVFAEYLCKAFLPALSSPAPPLAIKAVGLAGLWLITLLNWTGQKAGADFANKFLVVKIGALAVIAVSGIVSSALLGLGNGATKSPFGWFGVDPARAVPPPSEQVGNFVTATFAALFCYNGFESIGFVLGNIQAPSRNLPHILHSAMTIVLTGFVLTNTSLYMTLSLDELRSGNTPTITFANAVLGRIGAVVFSVVVAISALGALNANLFATASLSVAASQQGYFPSFIGNAHCASHASEMEAVDRIRQRLGRHAYLSLPFIALISSTATSRWEKHIPIFAMTINAILVTGYFVLGTSDSLLSFIGISQYLFYMLAVVGIFIIRRQPSDLEQLRVKTGTWNPVIFIACSCFVVVWGILSNPAQGGALLLLALVVFIGYGTRLLRRPRHEVEAVSARSSTSIELDATQ